MSRSTEDSTSSRNVHFLTFDLSQPIVTQVEVLEIDQCIQSFDLLDFVVRKVQAHQRPRQSVADAFETIGTQNQCLSMLEHAVSVHKIRPYLKLREASKIRDGSCAAFSKVDSLKM